MLEVSIPLYLTHFDTEKYWCISHHLSDAQNVQKDIYQQLQNRFEKEEGEAFLDHIMASNKVWVHHYTPENKR